MWLIYLKSERKFFLNTISQVFTLQKKWRILLLLLDKYFFNDEMNFIKKTKWRVIDKKWDFLISYNSLWLFFKMTSKWLMNLYTLFVVLIREMKSKNEIRIYNNTKLFENIGVLR